MPMADDDDGDDDDDDDNDDDDDDDDAASDVVGATGRLSKLMAVVSVGGISFRRRRLCQRLCEYDGGADEGRH